ncbi:hypothetical protein R1flu_013933 [Riccia fluitans]|uniref:Terpene synthase n=1 Tax=Riccia fluitans TaxID=41844 RepID=A0ABD1YHT4_9MARC
MKFDVWYTNTTNLIRYDCSTVRTSPWDKSPLLGWVHDMYSMASKAQRNLSKVFSMGSKAMSSNNSKGKKAVKVAVKNKLASTTATAGVTMNLGEAAVQRKMSMQKVQVASSSSHVLIDPDENYDIPEFVPPYEMAEIHPLTAEFTEETNRWLTHFQVDVQVGPKVWQKFLEEKISYLAGYVYAETEAKEFLWCCKYMSLILLLDFILDEPGRGDDVDDDLEKLENLILELNKVLMWFFSEDPHLRQQLKPLFSSFSASRQDAAISAFSKTLAHAFSSSNIGLMALRMQPIASAFRSIWLEYCEYLPYECNLRMARYIQNYLLGCIRETKNRKLQVFPSTLVEYIPLRRQSVGMEPLIVVTDLFIKSRHWVEIPNWVFYGPHMQRLLRALCDVVAWYNDVYSFPKEVLKQGDPHNLVFIISQEHDCSYMEAAIHAMEMIQNRMNDLETAASYLQVEAPYSCRNGVEEYSRICRQWVSGSHQFHQSSKTSSEDHRIL